MQSKTQASRYVLRALIGSIFLIVVLSGVCFFFFGIDLKEHLSYLPLCPFRAITKIPCPGCGMTHAFLDIGQFKIKEAITYNPFSVPLFCLMVVYLFFGRIPLWLKHRFLIYLAVISVLVVWILRLAVN